MRRHPTIADVAPGGMLPSERARAAAVDARLMMLEMFARKIGLPLTANPLKRADGTVDITLRPS